MPFSPDQDIAKSVAYANAQKAAGTFEPKPINVPAPPSVSSTLGFANPATNPISSTLPIRNENNLNSANAGELQNGVTSLENDILSKTTFSGSSAGERANQALQEAYDRYNTDFTSAEQRKIQSEQFAAGAQFEPLITSAEEQKRKELPKSVIAAGERGGLMSSQFSGTGAIDAGAGEFGQGGELANIKQVYDTAIENVRIKQRQAINTARIAAERAIRTGRKEDYDMAKAIFDDAKSGYEAEQKLAQDKADALSKIQQEQRLTKTAKGVEQDRALKRIQELGKSGVDISNFSPEELASLEETAGLPQGTAQAIIQASIDSQKVSSEQDQIDIAGKIMNIIDSIPDGQEITIGDSTYTGIKRGANRQITETDNAGNITIITTDDKGNIINTASGGRVGKTKVTPAGATTPQTFEDAVSQLDAGREADGFVNPGVYADVLNQFRKKGQTAKFYANFPPEEFLNPDDPLAKKYFQTSTQALKNDSGDALDSLILEALSAQ